jgi:hypothetical protein
MEAIDQETKTQKMLDVWFETLIDQLRADRTEISCGIAPKEKEVFYTKFVTKPVEEILNDNRKVLIMNYIERALKTYNEKLKEYDSKPLKVAFNFADSKVYVFAIIDNDDEKTEDALFLSEAYVNSKFREYGVHLSTTILEKDDNYKIPEHYKTFIG